LPKSVEKAEMAVEFLQKNGSNLLCKNLPLERNGIIAGEFQFTSFDEFPVLALIYSSTDT
jgi:hypothetical protein